MSSTTKTDNGQLEGKLELRRYFLRKYHADGRARVLDCCQGSGVLWGRLLGEFPVERYWGVDLKEAKGRLRIDSRRILEQPGWDLNCIDIDTYGSPWEHYLYVCRNLTEPTTVFLTWGIIGISAAPKIARQVLGLGRLKPPPMLLGRVFKKSLSSLLSIGCERVTILEAVEVASPSQTRYFGVRLEPAADTAAAKPQQRSA